MKFSAKTSKLLGTDDRDINTISNTELNNLAKNLNTADAIERALVTANKFIMAGSGVSIAIAVGVVATGVAPLTALLLPVGGLLMGVSCFSASKNFLEESAVARREIGEVMEQRDHMSAFFARTTQTLGTDNPALNQKSRLELLRMEAQGVGAKIASKALSATDAFYAVAGGGVSALGLSTGNPLLTGLGLIGGALGVASGYLGHKDNQKISAQLGSVKEELKVRTNRGPSFSTI